VASDLEGLSKAVTIGTLRRAVSLQYPVRLGASPRSALSYPGVSSVSYEFS